MSESYLGENTPKLGFGLMRLPRGADGQFDLELIKKMVDYFLENGFTYFDTAYVYQGSEEAACEALVKRHPRDKYTIATKLNINAALSGGMMFGGPPPEPMSTEEGQKKLLDMFETSLSRLGTDYIDYYLLHGLGGQSIQMAEQYDAWGLVKKLKDEGRIKHYGFSFHGTPEELDEVFTKHPDAEFVQLQINYLDWEAERVQSGKCYEVARKHNKPVTVMEPVKGGTLANENAVFAKHLKTIDPDASAASWALRYVAALPGMLVILSGMSAMEHMIDNVKTFKEMKPLDDEGRKAIAGAIEAINSVPSVPCTTCRYCKDCPQKISIPELFNLYNDYLVYGTINQRMYEMLTNGQGAPNFGGGPGGPGGPGGRPGGRGPGGPGGFGGFGMTGMGGGNPKDCLKCKLCEKECPQHIEISDLMEKIAAIAG